MTRSEIIELEKLAIMLYHEQQGEIAPAWQDIAQYERDYFRSESYRLLRECEGWLIATRPDLMK